MEDNGLYICSEFKIKMVQSGVMGKLSPSTDNLFIRNFIHTFV